MAGDEPSGGAGLFEAREWVFGTWARVRVHWPERCILPFAENFPCADGCACNQPGIVQSGLAGGVASVGGLRRWFSFERVCPAAW
jgi:hypothetical protein